MQIDINDITDCSVDAIKDLILGDLGDFIKHLVADVISGTNENPELTIDRYLNKGLSENFKKYMHDRIAVVSSSVPKTSIEIEELRQVFEKEKINYVTQFLPRVMFLFSQAKSGNIPSKDLVDVGFFLRELRDLFDEARKECSARYEAISARVAWNLLVDEVPKERGAYATASPSVKMIWKEPKPDTKEMEVLQNFLGVPPLASFTKFRFKETAKLLLTAIEDGREVPESLQATANPTVTYRRKNRKKT